MPTYRLAMKGPAMRREGAHTMGTMMSVTAGTMATGMAGIGRTRILAPSRTRADRAARARGRRIRATTLPATTRAMLREEEPQGRRADRQPRGQRARAV